MFFLSLPLFANSQNIILNSNFEEINICCEYNSKCGYKGWYFVGTDDLFRPKSENSERTLATFSPIINNGSNVKGFLIGTLLIPVLPNDKYKINFEFHSKNSIIIYYKLIKNFNSSDFYDFIEFDNLKFNKLVLNNASQISSSWQFNTDSSKFIVFSFHLLSEEITKFEYIYFKKIEMVIDKKFDVNQAYFSERIKFILNDCRRHFFSNTKNDNSIMNGN